MSATPLTTRKTGTQHCGRLAERRAGTALILLGIIAAIISVLRRSSEFGLATLASVASLILAGPIIILVVPPGPLGALKWPGSICRSGSPRVRHFPDCPRDCAAAWNTGNNLLFWFSFLVSTFRGLGRAGLADLVVSARFPDHIFAGSRRR